MKRTGGKVSINCQAEGLPEPTYEIKFKGTIINTNKADTIEVADSNLELYNCTSTNVLGSDTVNLTLPGKIVHISLPTHSKYHSEYSSIQILAIVVTLLSCLLINFRYSKFR